MINQSIQKFLAKQNPTSTLWITYSGGVDSHVLLHALAQAKKQNPALKVQAIHINHNLQKQSKQWQKHCEKTCKQYEIPFNAIEVDIPVSAKDGVEAAARELRYDAFKSFMQPNDYLLTAHHEDDQAETVLMRLVRGAGVKGLSAISELQNFGEGFLARPLLNCSKQTILDYAYKHNLKWIEDPSNRHLDFSRNFVRHEVMPRLSSHWQSASKKIAQVAEYMSEADELLNELAMLDMDSPVKPENDVAALSSPGAGAPSSSGLTGGSRHHTASIEKLRQLSLVRQKNALRYWIKSQGFIMPTQSILQSMIDDVLNAKEDAQPCVKWDGAEVRRFNHKLYIDRPLEDFDNTIILNWDLKSSLKLPSNLGELHPEQIQSSGVEIKPGDKIEIRFRQGGEKLKIAGREGTHTLKNLMQEWQVPSWQRDRVPLVYVNDELSLVFLF